MRDDKIPGPLKHHAIAFYNGPDKALVKALVRRLQGEGLKIWFADDSTSAERVHKAISDAIDSSHIGLFCIGPNGFDGADYMTRNELGMYWDRSDREALLVYVGAANLHGPSKLPPNSPFRNIRGFDLRRDPDGEAFATLVATLGAREVKRDPDEIAARRAAAAGTLEDAAALPGPEEERASADRFVSMMNIDAGGHRRGLTLFVGPYWPGVLIADRNQLSRDILRDFAPFEDNIAEILTRFSSTTSSADDKGGTADASARNKDDTSAFVDELLRHVPIAPPEIAAMARALNKEQDSKGASKDLTENFVLPRTIGEPRDFLTAAELVRSFGQFADAKLFPATVITTNTDCTLERAFLRQGVDFTRIVASSTDGTPCFRRTDFVGVRSRATEILVDGPRGNDAHAVSLSEEDLTRKRLEELEAHFEALDSQVRMALGDEGGGKVFRETLLLNELLQSYDGEFGEDIFVSADRAPQSSGRKRGGGFDAIQDLIESDDPKRPVLIKLFGSHLVSAHNLLDLAESADTSAIAFDQQLRLAHLMTDLRKIVATAMSNNITLLAGCCACDASFRIVYEFLLRDYVTDPDTPVFCVLTRPTPGQGILEAMRGEINNRAEAGGLLEKRLGMKFLQLSEPGLVIDAMLARLPETEDE